MKTLSPETQKILECLQAAVQKALERKKRLGQYAVVWEDNKPVFIGEDKPAGNRRRSSRFMTQGRGSEEDRKALAMIGAKRHN